MCDMVQRIRDEMSLKGMKQKDIIQLTGEKQSNISKYLSLNDNIRLDIPNTILAKLSDILDVDIKYLLCMQDEKRIRQNIFEGEDIQMIDKVDMLAGAGAEGVMIDNIEKTQVPIYKQFLKGLDPRNLVMIQVYGDSMYPTISPDEFVIVDMANGRDFHPVDGIYLVNKDGTIQIKRLHFRGDKGVDIISDNAAYPKENTKKDGINLEVIGKLTKQVKNLGSLAIK